MPRVIKSRAVSISSTPQDGIAAVQDAATVPDSATVSLTPSAPQPPLADAFDFDFIATPLPERVNKLAVPVVSPITVAQSPLVKARAPATLCLTPRAVTCLSPAASVRPRPLVAPDSGSSYASGMTLFEIDDDIAPPASVRAQQRQRVPRALMAQLESLGQPRVPVIGERQVARGSSGPPGPPRKLNLSSLQLLPVRPIAVDPVPTTSFHTPPTTPTCAPRTPQRSSTTARADVPTCSLSSLPSPARVDVPVRTHIVDDLPQQPQLFVWRSASDLITIHSHELAEHASVGAGPPASDTPVKASRKRVAGAPVTSSDLSIPKRVKTAASAQSQQAALRAHTIAV